MADTWARRDGGLSADDPILVEVPLTGTGALVAGDAEEIGGTPRGSPRRGLGIGVLVVAASVGVAALVLAIDADDGPDAATPDATALGGLDVTTPPTLRPLDSLPAPDDPQLRRALDEGPEATSSQDRSLFDDVRRPVYPAVTDVGLAEVVQYDIAGAVARLADDVPRRSVTHYELGSAGFLLDVTIERDPERNRYRIMLETQGESQTAVVDAATGTTYVRGDDGSAIDVLNADIIAGTTAADVNEYFDRLLLGPVRPDTFVAAATRGRSLVAIDDGNVARQFISNIQGTAIPEWQLYAFGPVFEFRPEDRPSLLEYAVYVTEAGRITQVDGLSLLGDVPQLVQHRLEQPTEPIQIDLPSPIDGPTPASSAPVSTPTSVPTSVPSTSPPSATTMTSIPGTGG